MKRLLVLILIFGFTPLSSFAFDHDYKALAGVLKEHVVYVNQHSYVRYNHLKRNKTQLNEFKKNIEAVTKAEYDSWTKDQQLAFLINVYNGMALKLITTSDNEVSSIDDIGGVFQNSLKKEFFTLFGEDCWLAQIRHDRIRIDFNEPRSHLALVPAAQGSPPLRNEPYLAKTLDAQLEDQARKFIQNPRKNIFMSNYPRHVRISNIFNWYRADFKNKYGDLKTFLKPYMADGDPDLGGKLMESNTHITFNRFNWELNRHGNE